MYLKDNNGDILLKYSTNAEGNIVNGLEEIKSPADFWNISDWLDYNEDVAKALKKLKKKGVIIK